MEPDKTMDLFCDLLQSSHRNCAIIGSAYVERCLQYALVKRLGISEEDETYKEFFSPQGAGKDFLAKAKIGYLLYLYGDSALKDLKAIAKIRNEAAHTWDEFSFESDRPAALARNFSLIDRYVRKPTDELKPTAANTTIKDFPFWFYDENVERMKSHPRGRFILTVRAFSYGLWSVKPEPSRQTYF
ncbi:hypothetical protein [uncultured Thalassospira sp.]|uniref:hypothetical protein n=1 Tax=uncultured Thalassospira sp. TaxID=404382 RepID=UPI00259A511B|nr:hypothetical protein [uncultured Thalassospira sp.]